VLDAKFVESVERKTEKRQFSFDCRARHLMIVKLRDFPSLKFSFLFDFDMNFLLDFLLTLRKLFFNFWNFHSPLKQTSFKSVQLQLQNSSQRHRCHHRYVIHRTPPKATKQKTTEHSANPTPFVYNFGFVFLCTRYKLTKLQLYICSSTRDIDSFAQFFFACCFFEASG
jgi:hypothetical protein